MDLAIARTLGELVHRGYAAPRPITVRRDQASVRMDHQTLRGPQSVFVRLVRAPLDAETSERLQSLEKLDHPNVVDVREAGADRGVLFGVSEYVWGFSLANALARAPLPSDLGLYVASEVARALDAVHPELVHGSLDSGDVLLSVLGDVKLSFPLLPPRASAGDDVAALRDLIEGLDLELPEEFPALRELESAAAVGATLAELTPRGAAGRLARHLADLCFY